VSFCFSVQTSPALSANMLSAGVVIDGTGIAVHHGYMSMSAKEGNLGIEGTDVLARYKLYAEEYVCGR
jgi:hypothetical protein